MEYTSSLEITADYTATTTPLSLQHPSTLLSGLYYLGNPRVTRLQVELATNSLQIRIPFWKGHPSLLTMPPRRPGAEMDVIELEANNSLPPGFFLSFG